MTTIPLEFPQARGHEAQELRFCRDCKWCDGLPLPRCLAPQNFSHAVSLVTGEPEAIPYRTYCEPHRMAGADENRCGASGRWFEPRESEQTEAAQ